MSKIAKKKKKKKEKKRVYLMGYIWYNVRVENLLNIRGSSRNLTTIGLPGKNNFHREYSRYYHKNKNLQDNFCKLPTWQWSVLAQALRSQMILISSKIERVFVTKFCQEYYL